MPTNFNTSRLNLAQKGFILLLVPMLLQLVLAIGLIALHVETERYVERCRHDCRLQEALSRFCVADYAYLDAIETAQTTGARAGLMDLMTALRTSAEQLIAMWSVQPEQHAKLTFFYLNKEKQQKEVATYCLTVKGMTDCAIQAHVKNEKHTLALARHHLTGLCGFTGEHVQKPGLKASGDRQLAGVCLTVLNLLILLCLLVIGWFFKSTVIAKLNIFLENMRLFARQQPLQERLSGSDEIDQLDRMFHDVAEYLIAARYSQKSLVENTRDLVCSFDAHGRFIVVSDSSATMLGYEPQELSGSLLMDLIAEESQHQTVEQVQRLSKGEELPPFETRLVRKDGATIDVLFSSSWSPLEQAAFCVVHDISARKATERAQREVMQMVSHDLRTPLTAICAFYEMAESGMFGEISPAGLKGLTVAQRSGQRMLTLINDLLEIDKMEAGMLDLELVEVSLADAFLQAVQTVKPLSDEKGVALEILPVALSVQADEHRMQQILVNLLSNAIKFSSRGKGVTIAAVAPSSNFIEIRIQDEGRGIPADQLAYVFDRFRQVEIADSKVKGGSGLGLAICKALVELHRGSVSVQSEWGRGSTFTVSLPRCAGAGRIKLSASMVSAHEHSR